MHCVVIVVRYGRNALFALAPLPFNEIFRDCGTKTSSGKLYRQLPVRIVQFKGNCKFIHSFREFHHSPSFNLILHAIIIVRLFQKYWLNPTHTAHTHHIHDWWTIHFAVAFRQFQDEWIRASQSWLALFCIRDDYFRSIITYHALIDSILGNAKLYNFSRTPPTINSNAKWVYIMMVYAMWVVTIWIGI